MNDASTIAPKRGWLVAAWRFIRGAPLTYLWLIVLLGTTIIQHRLTGPQLHQVLLHSYTNLHNLAVDPFSVLGSSLLWTEGRYWFPYLVLFTLFLAPAERWLGQIRWLTVGLVAHVAATYISEGVLYLQIQQHFASERVVFARDIGVSYFLVAIIAALAYHIARPWRWGYVAALILVFVAPMAINPGITSIGDLSAVAVGLCCYPITKRRAPPWNPAALLTRRSAAGPQAA